MKREREIKSDKKEIKKPNTSSETPVFPVHLSISEIDKDTLDDQTELWITIIDVGQGESTLIRYRQKMAGEKDWTDLHVMLVDGGRAHFAEHTIIPTLEQLGVKKINTMVCSHYDADHIEGLTEVIAKYSPEVLYERSITVCEDREKVFNFRKAFSRKSKCLKLNDIISFGAEKGDPEVKCVAVDNTGIIWTEENDYSIALLIKFGNFSFYLGGDLTFGVEDNLSLGGHVCAFKCGHHGSKHSTSAKFLGKIKPEAAFISASSHSYCHPDDELIKRLCDSDKIKKIYLTNCVYNRAGINSVFEERELALKKEIHLKIREWLTSLDNDELTEKPPPGFDEILALDYDDPEELDEKTDEEKETEFENLLKEEKIKIESGKIRKKLPGDENKDKRKRWNDLASLYYAAYDIHEQFEERKKRIAGKGVVAATKTHLGNVHLIVSGANVLAEKHKFDVYFSNGAKMKMIAHECGADASLEIDSVRPDVKIVSRKEYYKFIPAFSMITGPSGEERQNLTPDEVADLSDKIDDFTHLIENIEEEWIFMDIVEAMIYKNAFPLDPKNIKLKEIVNDYRELLKFYKKVSDQWGEDYSLMNPSEEAVKALENLKKSFNTMSDGDEEYQDD